MWKIKTFSVLLLLDLKMFKEMPNIQIYSNRGDRLQPRQIHEDKRHAGNNSLQKNRTTCSKINFESWCPQTMFQLVGGNVARLNKIARLNRIARLKYEKL